MLNDSIKTSINNSVLCWLATASAEHFPNVSPKEVFTYHGEHHIIIANIASPGSISNIKVNPQVCVSFIDIFIQKGYQLKGLATIITEQHLEFRALAKPLLEITQGKYPFKSLIKIEVKKVKPIIAPSYIMYPETTEADQIESAYKTYKIK